MRVTCNADVVPNYCGKDKDEFMFHKSILHTEMYYPAVMKLLGGKD